MATVTLAGKTMQRRPLLVEDLFVVYTMPGMDDFDGAGYGQRVGLELLARSLVVDPPMTADVLRNLPASEWRALVSAIREVQAECGFRPAGETPPGEASGPVTP